MTSIFYPRSWHSGWWKCSPCWLASIKPGSCQVNPPTLIYIEFLLIFRSHLMTLRLEYLWLYTLRNPLIQLIGNIWLRSLKFFHFDPTFHRWFELFYKSPMTQIKLGGELSSPFLIWRGTRKRSPLSLVLFALAMEPLAATLSQTRSLAFTWAR